MNFSFLYVNIHKGKWKGTNGVSIEIDTVLVDSTHAFNVMDVRNRTTTWWQQGSSETKSLEISTSKRLKRKVERPREKYWALNVIRAIGTVVLEDAENGRLNIELG